MAKRGHKSCYTPELAKVICERLSAGESLLSICREPGMPPASSVRWWVIDDREGFAAEYARARDVGLEHMAEELLVIASDKERDANCRRVEIDARKWYLSKLAPKRYGDRLDTRLVDAAGEDREITVTLVPVIPRASVVSDRKAIEPGEPEE